MWRDAFHALIEPEAFIPVSDVLNLLRDAGPWGATEEDLESILGRARSWADESAAAHLALQDHGAEVRTAVHTVLLQSSPVAATSGAWLQGMTAPGVFDDPAHLRVLELHAGDIGVGQPRTSRFDLFRMLSKQWGLPEVDVDPAELVSLRGVRDEMFLLPAALLALSRRSDAFGPVIAGVDLVMRTVGMLPCWRAVDSLSGTTLDLSGLDLGTFSRASSRTPLELSRLVSDAYARSEGEAGELRCGVEWAYGALRRWDQGLRGEVAAMLHPETAMAALVRERSREASVYHDDFQLGGTSLSSLLAAAKDDPAPLLAELAQSRLVRPGASARSALINGLIGPRGPMFRVFSPDDVATIGRWIDWLGAEREDARQPEAPSGGALLDARVIEEDRALTRDDGPSRIADLAAHSVDQEVGATPANVREAFHVLQGRALAPATREFAVRYVKRWLARAEQSLSNAENSLPTTWTHEGTRPWLLDMHDRQSLEFEGSSAEELPTREEVIDSTLQLAPLTLIDGAWLQGFTDNTLAPTNVGFPLYETYWDELGNGDIELNHPKIYRDVLREMGITLAATGSREFAEDTRFRDESFERPVYWLCLGKLPTTFLPEILGMNLAMELSGVGGSYRTARRFLKHYGFSTHFVDLHNTIDNVSTGHSAWAADAIDTHMRAFKRRASEEAAQEWDRIRIGYQSLSPRPSKLTARIGTRLLPSPWKPPSGDRTLLHHQPVGAAL